MWTRRQFLSKGSLGLVAGTAYAFAGDNKAANDGHDAEIPDGSASKDMITPEADKAVAGGLKYLSVSQRSDGGFGTGGYNGNVAVTSLAALAFMAGGHQPNRGLYGATVTKALKFILSMEARDDRHTPGYLFNPTASPHGHMYGHGFATLFLAEVSGMVHDKALREDLRLKLERAVKLIVNSQNAQGGWRYTPNSHEADISVTICQIMALRAARNAGVFVPKSTVDRCVKYVKDCQDKLQGSFRYMPAGGGGGPPFARTAAGLCALYSAGIYSGEEISLGLNYLMNYLPTRGRNFSGAEREIQYFYGHYYAVQAMWTAGGDYWKRWFPAIRDELVDRQRQLGDGTGCWLDALCTHYGTAMACIILQVPNNYLPILQK